MSALAWWKSAASDSWTHKVNECFKTNQPFGVIALPSFQLVDLLGELFDPIIQDDRFANAFEDVAHRGHAASSG
ncbi:MULTISPECIES: hypothetical protein [unclassified Rhodanobacter]|uniref:Uncharacterized protein n=1 Tax=Rhodanobacter humi TaxID=1888173 RepID=A0ABV4AWJ6_9GAMM